MIQELSYELSVLAKAVQHKNLSAASAHVGLSQPQLSRLITKIEKELNIVLLDRSARRKSGWTSLAQELAFTYSKSIGRMESEIRSLVQDLELRELHIGTLEGLSNIAIEFVKEIVKLNQIQLVYLDVYDFKELDANFLSGNLDIIFTVKSPGKQKFNHILEVGFQHLDRVESDPNTLVVSPYELVSVNKKELNDKKLIVSNSLSLREHWLRNFGGTGILPTGAQTGKGRGQFTVYLLGSELLSPSLWKHIKNQY